MEAEADKRTNRALFIVAILAVFTAVWDGAELLEAILTNSKGLAFSVLSLIAVVTVYLAIFFFLRKKN